MTLEAEIPLGVCCSSPGEFRMVAVQRKDWGNIGGLGVFVLEETGEREVDEAKHEW